MAAAEATDDDLILADAFPAITFVGSHIGQAVPGAQVRFGQGDLADLASIASFAAKLAQEQDSLELLINKAGVMRPSVRRETSDGFELQFGTNYLGHFALTAHLLPLLKRGRRPRVVTLGSVAARSTSTTFRRSAATSRCRSTANPNACIMFAFEMSRRSKAAGWVSTASRPIRASHVPI
jgi:NAD(P)-dependent dehydrogenase (short-subunit alcohol dehydrogenase family)